MSHGLSSMVVLELSSGFPLVPLLSGAAGAFLIWCLGGYWFLWGLLMVFLVFFLGFCFCGGFSGVGLFCQSALVSTGLSRVASFFGSWLQPDSLNLLG